jgi:hypothetical protein
MPTDPAWPDIPYAPWRDTARALHLWLQIVGKYRLANTPWLNHGWHATLEVTPRGLTTGPIHLRDVSVALLFDLVDHRLRAECSSGRAAGFALAPMSVADFLARVRESVGELGLPFAIHGRPNEIPDAIPFAADAAPRPYDAEAVGRFHRALLAADRVFRRFRTGFLGKSSPSHLFWGSFDLAVTRFSGRAAPPHPGGIPGLPDAVTREAYSHEVSSAGFWAGEGVGEPMFYSYAWPSPPGFAEAAISSAAARWDAGLGEFLLPWAAVRASPDPEATLLSFLQSTYAAAADRADWPRAALERPMGGLGVVSCDLLPWNVPAMR